MHTYIRVLMSGKINITELGKLSDIASDYYSRLHDIIVEPFPTKQAPFLNSNQIATLCDLERVNQMTWLEKKHSLPFGKSVDGKKSKLYTITDAIQWVKTVGKYYKRPEGKLGKVIAVVNYKGGVQKTTTTVTMAQALTLRGYKVVVLDCDPQGSATQLLGFKPEEHITANDTISPYLSGYWEEDINGNDIDEAPPEDLRYSVRTTYWDNLMLIPACSKILAAEYFLPLRLPKDGPLRVLGTLRKGLLPILEDFDVCLIDTSPSLNHLTINSIYAADGLLMPCPPAQLDFVSSISFWSVFDDVMNTLKAKDFPDQKTFDFVDIIRTRYKPELQTEEPQSNNNADIKYKRDRDKFAVSEMMKEAYGSLLCEHSIRDSAIAREAALGFKTAYDLLDKDESKNKSFKDYKNDLDILANHIVSNLKKGWEE